MSRIYCLHDVVAEEAGPMFEARNDAVARRIFETLDDKAFPPGSDRGDFRLLKLGSFFHGSEKEGPNLKALSKPLDVTRHDRLMDDLEDPDEAVS
jgi:hypothetical protein